jgi:LmbE family N-acetylglucosaminyl deacetylase
LDLADLALSRQTLLVGLAHPDDELGMAGTLLAQRALGDRVVIAWLTRGEQTEAFGPLSVDEVARRRQMQGERAADILGAEPLFLDLPDTSVAYERDTLVRLAQLYCEIKPDGLLTWGDAWVRGMRHPDHQVAGRLFRDAVTLARMAKIVAPLTPHRKPVPIYTLRDVHSQLPAAGVDVTPHRDAIADLATHYRIGLGFGDPEWLERRLLDAGSRWGCRYAEEFDAWESMPESTASLLPSQPLEGVAHPDRPEGREGTGNREQGTGDRR